MNSSTRLGREFVHAVGASGKSSKHTGVATRLATTEKYPLSKRLFDVFPYKDSRKVVSAREKISATVDIVSPDLCDDVLEYIAPSLEPYKGCDIIDIHPGACLWSQKLHDFLKPRCHLLMEPNETYADNFIKPLLEQPGSTYRHTNLSGAHPKSYWDSYKHIFDGKLLPEREPLEKDDPRLRQLNRSLLVTGTVHRKYNDWRGYVNNVNTQNLILNHFVQASQANGLFHTHGLVRMLLWHPEEGKIGQIPHNINMRTAYATNFEMAADVVEVAGEEKLRHTNMDKRNRKFKYRSLELDEKSLDVVVERMERTNTHMPAHRQGQAFKAALDRKEAAVSAEESGHLPESDCADSYGDLAAKVSSIEKTTDAVMQALTSRKETLALDDSYDFRFPEQDLLSNMYNEIFKNKIGHQLAVDLSLQKAEQAYARALPHLSQQESKELKGRLLTISRRLRESRANMLIKLANGSVQLLIDEPRALTMDPAPLAYDRRPFEPLVAREEEFYPRFQLCLLDLQPRIENFASDITSASEGNHLAREFLTALFHRASNGIPAALDKIAPNGAQDLIPKVPAITDPLRGGRLDPNDVIVKMLTREMLTDLCTAFIEWPFRPAQAEIALMNADVASIGDSDADETEVE